MRARARQARATSPSDAARSGIPGSNVRLIMRSPCTSSMRDAAKPPISACRTLAGSAPALDANSSASRDGLDVQRDDDLVGDLAVCPVAVLADERDVLAHQLEQRLHFIERGLGPPDHDGERRILRADFAARDRRVHVIASELVRRALRTLWSRSARSSSCRSTILPLVSPRRRRCVRTAPSRHPACPAP